MRGPKRPNHREPVAVMFVPRTPGGKLLSQLREIETSLARINPKTIRLVEEGGLKLKEALCKSDPWENTHCGRDLCSTCPTANPGSCRTKNIVYQNICLPCREQEISTRYIGESNRTMWERGLEHHKDSLDHTQSSHIRDHINSSHPELIGDLLGGTKLFSMQLIKPTRTALSRQLREAVEISTNTTRGTLLNSKEEFTRCLIPCIQVEDPRQKNKEVRPEPEQDKQLLSSEEETSTLMNRDMKRGRRCNTNISTSTSTNNRLSKRRKVTSRRRQMSEPGTEHDNDKPEDRENTEENSTHSKEEENMTEEEKQY